MSSSSRSTPIPFSAVKRGKRAACSPAASMPRAGQSCLPMTRGRTRPMRPVRRTRSRLRLARVAELDGPQRRRARPLQHQPRHPQSGLGLQRHGARRRHHLAGAARRNARAAGIQEPAPHASGVLFRAVRSRAQAAPARSLSLLLPRTARRSAARPGMTGRFFGDALINHALRQPLPFDVQLRRATALISAAEEQANLTPSNPQVSIGSDTATWLNTARCPRAEGCIQPCRRAYPRPRNLASLYAHAPSPHRLRRFALRP